MANSILISNITIADALTGEFNGDIFLRGGKIVEVATRIDRTADIHIDAANKNWSALPGFVDVHIHGAAGFDAMDATAEALGGIAAALPNEGTTSFLATTMTQSENAIDEALENASRFTAGDGQAEMLGIHLEGPFISAKRAGAQPLEHITAPSIQQFEKWQERSGNRIKLVTVASEAEDGLEFIEAVSKSGVIASIGHTDATFEQVQEAVNKGASHVTHLYNQMSPLHHRNPGVVGASLLEDALTVEVIADFVHSHPQAVALAFRQKGASRMVLITDAMRAKGLAPGVYDLGGQEVQVTETDARLSDGTLAGSILTMEAAVKNVASVTGCTLADLVAMTSANAAKELGLEHKGSIAAGKDADITILDEQFNVQLTICRGTIAYSKEELS
ncbi:N-acetylglucosamine-6-phosphate deacetylase [Planomicrobium sp. CPCC 101079]|uniref:N-acetylglucosamine-6-phosphate deacetylase n=1 Tax=Planomicrobium sp. CPCC 101079 TaxID=2599618 RepID=UPI0011B42F81|nr:N-acetylglucosamine-6-phosphate deacetylase [Planomicrobium sp. CPCC 101079]TWT13315.1 N-acetylglucosamine-6-phosphate deacetylase [Planomicrobium sp. CPCC 101079]